MMIFTAKPNKSTYTNMKTGVTRLYWMGMSPTKEDMLM